MALIDAAVSAHTIYPYARTASVPEVSNEENIFINLQDLALGMKIGTGIFLTPDNNKGNLMFNAQGSIVIGAASAGMSAYPIFGRTDASAVTSSKTGVENELAEYKMIAQSHFQSDNVLVVSFNTQIFGEWQDGANNWCLAWVIANTTGGAITFSANASLAIQKYSVATDVYRPERN